MCWRDKQKKKRRKGYWQEKITQYGISSGLEKIMLFGLSTIPVKKIKLRTLKLVQIHAVHTLTNSYVPGHSLWTTISYYNLLVATSSMLQFESMFLNNWKWIKNYLSPDTKHTSSRPVSDYPISHKNQLQHKYVLQTNMETWAFFLPSSHFLLV
jgi:hypothetical protein